MTSLMLAAAVFLAIHFLISGTALRGALVGMIGERVYLGLFSAVSLACIVWLSQSYGVALADEGNTFLWNAPAWWPHLAGILVLIAFLFVVTGMLSPNPGAVGQERAAEREPAGIQRVTRHPFLWGVSIWAVTHLVANGDLASLILFGSLFLLSLGGTFSIDAKRRRSMGAAWEAYSAKTSNLPFAAILGGRQKLSLREIGWVKLLAAVGFYGVAFALHPMLFGVSPA